MRDFLEYLTHRLGECLWAARVAHDRQKQIEYLVEWIIHEHRFVFVNETFTVQNECIYGKHKKIRMEKTKYFTSCMLFFKKKSRIIINNRHQMIVKLIPELYARLPIYLLKLQWSRQLLVPINLRERQLRRIKRGFAFHGIL